MKKTYQNPEIKIVIVHTIQMLANSDPDYGGETSATEGNLSRESSFWGDDDEEQKDYSIKKRRMVSP